MGDVANKDEAEKCRQIGLAALQSSDLERSLKFLQKSERLYPLPGIKSLISDVESRIKAGGSSARSSPSPSASSSEPEARRRPTPATPSTPSSSSSSASSSSSSKPVPVLGKDYTQEQSDMATKILKTKDFYERLGVEKSAAEEDLKRAYKKLALRLHPDKNKAPNAEEAFKAVSVAFGTLSDANKRSDYDQYGMSEEEMQSRMAQRQSNRANGYGHYQHGFSEDDLQDIFAQFFGGGHPLFAQQRSGLHRRRTQTARQQDDEPHTYRQQHRQPDNTAFYSQLVQLLPIILILFVSFFSFGGNNSSQPQFAFSRSSGYKHEHNIVVGNYEKDGHTQQFDFKIYATPELYADLRNKDRASLAAFERNAAAQLQTSLARSCEQERYVKRNAENEAQYYWNSAKRNAEMAKARAMPEPSCEKYYNLASAMDNARYNK